CGIGNTLLVAAHARWLKRGVDRVHLTAALEPARALESLLRRTGFTELGVDRARYGPERDELVFGWTSTSWTDRLGLRPYLSRVLSHDHAFEIPKEAD